jgi:hypothetical protein
LAVGDWGSPYQEGKSVMSRMQGFQSEQSMRAKAGESIQQHPDEAVLVALAAGAVVGLLIGTMLASPSDSTMQRSRRAAEGLGERLMSSIEKMIPESLSQTLGMHR